MQHQEQFGISVSFFNLENAPGGPLTVSQSIVTDYDCLFEMKAIFKGQPDSLTEIKMISVAPLQQLFPFLLHGPQSSQWTANYGLGFALLLSFNHWSQSLIVAIEMWLSE